MAKKKQAPARPSTLDDLIAGGLRYDDTSAAPVQEEAAPQERGMLRTAADYGISALKGAISVPESIVGLADIPTGGRVGRALEGVGFRPRDAKQFLDEQYSDQQKDAFRAVQDAEGFGGKLVAAVQNPSVIAHTVAESLPAMGAGGVVGRGLMAAAPRMGAVGAAAAGEGIIGAGSAAEQIRQETPDGLTTPAQSGLALASGGATMLFGALGNKVAKSLGIADVDTMLVGAAQNQAAAKGIVRRVLEGAVSEGILEELPQSVSEQVMQNVALGREVTEGVDQAAVLGMLSGATMGGGVNVLSGRAPAPQPVIPGADVPPAAPVAPPAGPLARAAGTVAPAAVPDVAAPADPGPDADVPPSDRFTPEEVRAFNNAYRREVPDPLGELRGQVQAETAYTTPNDVQAVGRSVEDAWLRDNVTNAPAAAPVAPAEPAPAEPAAIEQVGDAVGQVDARVRETRIAEGLQNILNDAPANTMATVRQLNVALGRIGEAPLSQDERARVKRAMDAQAGFTGKTDPAPLPVAPAPAVDTAASNAPLEALIPERKPKPAAQAAAPGSPQVFPTYEEADSYRREQRRRGATISALPVAAEGGFTLATSGTPEYAQGVTLRDERRAAKERADAGILDGDIVNRLGKPFTVRLPAMNAAKKAGPGHQVVPVTGGFVVRKGAADGTADAVQRGPDAGDRVGGADAAGGVEPAPGRNGAPGPAATAGSPPAAAPAQPGDVGRAGTADAVSDADPELTTAMADDFERLYQQDVKADLQRRRGVAPAPAEARAKQSPLRAFLREHGIAPELAADVTGERGLRANQRLPATFRKGGKQLDELVTLARERGFLMDSDVESAADTGGTRRLVEMIQAELRGERQTTTDAADDVAADAVASRASDDLQRQADAIGFDTRGLDDAQVADSLKRIERRRARADERGRAFDVRAEAADERQAITAASLDIPDDVLDALADEENNATVEDAMRALGFTEQEIQDATSNQPESARTSREGGGRPAETAREPASRRGRADQGTEGQEGLTSPTPADVERQQDRATEGARAQARADQDAERRNRADAERAEFTLTGSDRAADVAAAGGQNALFSRGSTPTIRDISDAWTARGIKNTLSERHGVITVSQIVVPTDTRGQGAGTSAMRELSAYADRTSQRIELSPSVDFGATSRTRLVQFYKRFGFIENKGRNRDFTTREAMIREPKPNESPASSSDDASKFSRAPATPAAAADRLAAVQRMVDELTAGWANAPRVVVAQNIDDPKVPQAIRRERDKRESKADGEVRAVFHGGTVYLLADQLPTDASAAIALFHEALGHGGLRGAFGDALTPILRDIARLRRADIAEKAREYGLDPANEQDRLMAAEEVLAEWAQRRPEIGWVRRAVAAIRQWLRKNMPGLAKLRMTDDEIVGNFLMPARGWVERGRAAQREPDAAPSPAFSRSAALNDPRQFRDKAGQALTDLFNAPGSVGWWHKTVGTMHNMARRSPKFGRVFDAVQEFLQDVSHYATEAADLAPNILPKLETWRDIGKSPLSAEDTKAIAAPIFEGTLTWTRDARGKLVKAKDDEQPAGVVFTDAELREQFKATPQQIALYREFRAATDQSLNRMTISEMLRFGGKDVAAVRDMAMDAGTAEEAAAILRQHLDALAEEQPNRKTVLADTATRIEEKAARAQELIERGYAPLSRFGHYTLDVLDEQGERAYFGMFESRAEANRMARRMRENFPKGTITQGTVSEQAYKMFAGITPETLELFGEMVGLEADGDEAQHQLFQQYLKLAKANRSAMKRLIHRKGIAGFSEDAGRVLAGFIYSNARLTSTNLHTGEISQATADISKNDGELKDMAIKLADYVRNPQEEAQALRGLMFVQYLGGSLASAMVNMTQPVAVTMPYLSQWGGAVKAARRMRAALADVMKKSTGDKALDEALKRAEADGIVAPQEVHQLMAQASGRGSLRAGDGTTMGNARAKASNALSKVALAWGKPFALAEQFNRRVTFIAAYRTAVAEGQGDPARFAERAIQDTQFVYNKGCVDEQTECLTVAGWKKHGDLKEGERVYAVNADGALVESTLVDVHRYSEGGYDALDFRNANGFSMVLTPEHKCLVQNYNSRDKKFQRPRLVRADEVKTGHHFVRVPQGDAMNRMATYTDDEVRLFAWVAAEGCLFAHRSCITKRGVNLSQSVSHNPHYVAEIDALLLALGGHHTRHTVKSGTMVHWSLRKVLWSKVHEALPGKFITHEFVAKLTPSQMALFLDTFAKGDGHFPEDGGPVITQKSLANLGALQAMAVLSGQSSTLYERMGRHDFGVLAVAKTSKRAHRAALEVERLKLDMVWCPQTEHGTWIARRNGRTFVTGNSRPQWARGAIGSTLFTFKQYSISYVELLQRMYQSGPEGKRAAAFAVAMLFLMSGTGGLPFMGDAEDILDGIMQRLGYSFSSKQARKQFLIDTLGQHAAEFVERGVSGLPGVPIDVAGRLGMDNLIPGTGLLTKKADYGRDVAEILGPAGDLAKRVFQGAGQIAGGDVVRGVGTMSPKAIANAGQALDMYQTGMYRDQRGRKVVDADGYDALIKGIGFQPSAVAAVQDATGTQQQMIAQNRMMKSELADAMAQAMFEKDATAQAAVRERVQMWNQRNPSSPLSLDMGGVRKRLAAMRSSKAERVEKAAPAGIRSEVRRALAESPA
jgi:hypothetical protein